MNLVPWRSQPMAWVLGFNWKLHLYTKHFSSKVTLNVFISVNFCNPLELIDKFRNYHFGVLKEVVDATRQNMGFDDIDNIFQGFDVKEMHNVESWCIVLHRNFGSVNGKGAGLVIWIGEPSLDDVEGGLILKSSTAWTTWGWFWFLAIVRVRRFLGNLEEESLGCKEVSKRECEGFV